MKLNNPHDTLVKVTLGIAEAAIEFMETFLPGETVKFLDLNTLNMSSTETTDENFNPYFSDLNFYCLSKNGKKVRIALLVEHKSYLPDYPHIQPLSYIANGWNNQTKRTKKAKPQKPDLTIPVILYHGRRKWKQLSFEEYFDLPDQSFKRYIPSYEYVLVDLWECSDRQIENLKTGYLITTLLLLKHYLETDYLEINIRKIFIRLDRRMDAQSGFNFFKMALLYYGEVTKFESTKYQELVTKLPKFMETTALSTWGIARQEGIKEGIQKGKEEVLSNFFLNLPNVSDDVISKIVKLPVKTVKEARKQFLKQNDSRKA